MIGSRARMNNIPGENNGAIGGTVIGLGILFSQGESYILLHI